MRAGAVAAGLLLAGPGLVACQGDEPDAARGERAAADYLPLADAAWTWRDDGGTEPPDEAELLHARSQGEGEVGIRRGSRWADAAPVGSLVFDINDGIALVGWDLPGASGGTARPLAPAVVVDGSRVGAAGKACTSALDVVVETFYATFDRTLVVRCEGGSFPGGTWVFAEDIGLVAMDAEALPVELVAPW